MGKTKDEGKSKNFRWPKVMSQTLLGLLVAETMKGKKSKSSATFKADSKARVAKKISEKFGVECSPDHIENHLRTVRKEWRIISTLRSKSGFGWDENLKMITADKEVYTKEVMAHPSHEKYINKKIEMFDELAIVIGKDIPTGNFAKSSADIDLENNTYSNSTPVDDVEMSEELEKTTGNSSSTSPPSEMERGGKRKRGEHGAVPVSEDDGLNKLVTKLDKIAAAISSLTNNQFNLDLLFDEVMKTKDFDVDFLGSVFDYLAHNEIDGKAFLAKNAYLRRKWIEGFIRQSGTAPSVTNSAPSSVTKSGGKQKQEAVPLPEDNGSTKLGTKLDNITAAISNLTKNQFNLDLLFDEVLKTKGFDEDVLDSVFDYLAQNEIDGRAFLAKNAYFRKKWIEGFIRRGGGGLI